MARDSLRKAPYPRPGPAGGALIRRMHALLQSAKFSASIDSYIHCACSGGADSIALAHLLQKYGRKFIPRAKIRLLHVNHGWRGSASDEDARWVEALGEEWGIPTELVDCRGREMRSGESWEDAARQQRKVAFSAALQRHPGFIFTAHHADDLAETVLWRLLTGNVASQAGGIQVIFKNEVRPLLQARRHHLREYLGEEGIGWREDSTNSEGRFLRSKMRVQLMPELTRLFPRGVDHLVRWALEEQGVLPRHQPPDGGDADEALGHLALIRLAGVRARRSHWEAIEQKAVSKNWTGELLLPGGWRIRKESLNQDRSERWILEKSSSE